MKFLADENIPLEVVAKLKDDGFDIKSVTEVQFGFSDEEVLGIANKEERTIITFDKDFGEMVYKKKMKSTGIILLRAHPQSVEKVYSLLKKAFEVKAEFTKSFCVVEKHRIRIIPLMLESEGF